MTAGSDGVPMIYNRFRVIVNDQYRPPSYPSESMDSHLAGVAVASSSQWDVSPDDQLHMVICHSGQYNKAGLIVISSLMKKVMFSGERVCLFVCLSVCLSVGPLDYSYIEANNFYGQKSLPTLNSYLDTVRLKRRKS